MKVQFALLLLLTGCVSGTAVRYDLSLEGRVHREAEITVTFRNVPRRPLQVRMSRSSPGRYALHEFAKNVYNVRAEDSKGRVLQITRPNPHQWDVRGHDGTVIFRYTLFADRADGTYSQVSPEHAHLNMPATFAWARGLERRPIELRIKIPEGWKVATQLVPMADGGFSAPNLQYFMDSPTEVADLQFAEFKAGEQRIRLAVHHQGDQAQVDEFARLAEKVVAEQIAIFGEAPRFDHGVYTFISDYGAWASGDGMEHRNSTILSGRLSLKEPHRALGTLSHEFFHAWNVERIRPRSLEPFDFERANMSGELWFGEGFTSYYGNLAIVRAGERSFDDWVGQVGRALSRVINGSGRLLHSPVEVSRRAPFVDAARSVDPQNRGNIFISYYTYGNAIAIGLDLWLRQWHGRTLDDYMRAVWKAHGRTEIPYTMADLERILAEVTGDPVASKAFFDRVVRGRDVPDYAVLLAKAGIVMRRARPEAATLGRASFKFTRRGAEIVELLHFASPLRKAGLDRGDRIRSIDGIEVPSQRVLDTILSKHNPGDVVTVVFDRGEARVTLAQDPALVFEPFEKAGRPVTDEIRAFRKAWLGSKAD